MRNYLAISLYDDSGRFTNTQNETDLELACSIHYLTGEFDTRSLNLNISNTYTPTSGDKFFFLPGVTVPRVKMKDLHKEYNVKSVRDIEEANIIFTGAKTFDALSDYSWEHRINADQVRAFIQTAKDKDLITDYYHEKLSTALEFYTLEEIIIDYGTARLLHDDDISFCIDLSYGHSSERFLKINTDQQALYDYIKDKQLYSEDSIYEYINGADAVTIDESMYEVLSEMFASSDTDNHVLAMEIMANCDYKSSILHLCYLFYTHSYKIEQRRERTHVNFKSLLTYMGTTTGNVALDKDDMVALMMKKKLFTKEFFFKICEKFKGELEDTSSTHFKVKSVSSSTEVNEYFNEELVYQVEKDYLPVQETIITQNEFTNTELDII